MGFLFKRAEVHCRGATGWAYERAFNLRVESIGALYFRKDHLKRAWKKGIKIFDKGVGDGALGFEVGPFVRTLDCGDPEDECPLSRVKNPNRGPFRNAGEWLSSIPEYERAFAQQHFKEALEESVSIKTPPNLTGENADVSSNSIWESDNKNLTSHSHRYRPSWT